MYILNIEMKNILKDKLQIFKSYKGQSKSFAIRYDAQMTQAKPNF